ncbi:MAG: hypothetical protein LBB58_05885 [Cellulomonadaceae bacterium]|jgi:hypothetical protein|nr:hypothetical protein [Cellulomonadaceae bacterium]
MGFDARKPAKSLGFRAKPAPLGVGGGAPPDQSFVAHVTALKNDFATPIENDFGGHGQNATTSAGKRRRCTSFAAQKSALLHDQAAPEPPRHLAGERARMIIKV